MKQFMVKFSYYCCIGFAIGGVIHKDFAAASMGLSICILINQSRAKKQ